MKLSIPLTLLVAYCSSWSAFGSVTIDKSTTGTSLFSLLGFSDNAACNAAQISDSGFLNASETLTFSLISESAANKSHNELGVYSYDSNGKVTGTATIFAGTASAGATASITIRADGSLVCGSTVLSGNYGFYFKNKSGTYFYSATGSTANQFVALSTTDTSYSAYSAILAMEDKLLGSSDHDYNDMVVAFDEKCTAVPEPSTFVAGLLLLLPLGVGFFRRLRCSRRS